MRLLPKARNENLEDQALLFGLVRRRYLWGIFVETDGRLRKRLEFRIRSPLGPSVGDVVKTVGPGRVEFRLNKHGMQRLAEAHGVRRRWWWTRSMFARVLIARMERSRPVGVSVGYHIKGERVEPRDATIMPREKQ